MGELALRLSRQDDLARLCELVSAYHRFEGIESDAVRLRETLSPLLGTSPLGVIWLIEAAGQPVGYVALTFGYSIEFGGRDAFVDELYIEPEHRGKGLGTEALRITTSRAKALGIHALHLEVGHANERARRIYESLGFLPRDRFLLMSAAL
jgi:ribosomal protein S18 acetylase RimI-like enzyme